LENELGIVTYWGKRKTRVQIINTGWLLTLN